MHRFSHGGGPDARNAQAPGRDLGLMIRVHQQVVTASDGFRYPHTKRFFFLYLFLAWQRRMPHAPDDGFLWCDLICELGETDRAWTTAHTARAVAERAGNHLDLAEVILMVGKLHGLAWEMEQGRRWPDCSKLNILSERIKYPTD